MTNTMTVFVFSYIPKYNLAYMKCKVIKHSFVFFHLISGNPVKNTAEAAQAQKKS